MSYWHVHTDHRYAYLKLLTNDEPWKARYLSPISTGLPHRVLSSWSVPKVRFIRDQEATKEVEDLTPPPPYRRNSNIVTLLGYITVWDTKARECLEPLVGDCVELLPLECEETGGSPLWAVNVIRVVDCLDHSQSKINYFKSGNIAGVSHYVFKPGCLEGQHLFRMPEHNYGWVIASDTFKNRVESCGLTGLEFELAWE